MRRVSKDISQARSRARSLILRRKSDTFERIVREELGGELFATEGNLDGYFKNNAVHNIMPVSEAELLDLTNTFGLVRAAYPGKLLSIPVPPRVLTPGFRERIAYTIEEHVRLAGERESARLDLWWNSYRECNIRRHRLSDSALKDACIRNNCNE
jgi:hypothetical protein